MTTDKIVYAAYPVYVPVIIQRADCSVERVHYLMNGTSSRQIVINTYGGDPSTSATTGGTP